MNNKKTNESKNVTLNIDSSDCEEISKINVRTKNKEENYEDCSLSSISEIGEKMIYLQKIRKVLLYILIPKIN